MTERSAGVGWLDCSTGVSGDMLLGALIGVGVLDDLADVVASVAGLDATVEISAVHRGALAATQVVVRGPVDPPRRRPDDLLQLIAAAPVPEPVRVRAAAVVERLATAEAAVHAIPRADVHFHEVGAVDTVVDVLGVCLGVHRLGLAVLGVGPVALGGGSVETAHGALPLPGPAVLELLRGSGLATVGGPVAVELATPTGAALLAELAAPVPLLPPMTVDRVGVGAGGRDLPDRANVVRLVLGSAPQPEQTDAGWVLLETNVDDLDPRLWPGVLDALLRAGAADAWLTPILMKKGRPAQMLSVLSTADGAAAAARVVFRETSAIGLRSTPVGKQALDRDWVSVDVAGHAVRVKRARLDGAVVNAVPEWEDVAAAAAALARPAKAVLADAIAAAQLLED